MRAASLELSETAPANWISVNLGLLSLSVPPPIEWIEPRRQLGVCFKGGHITIETLDLLHARGVVEGAKADQGFELFSNGSWRSAGYMEYAHAARLASSLDFRWNSSLEEVLSLQHLLAFKAICGSVHTRLFSTRDVFGMVSVFENQKAAQGDIDYVGIFVAPTDERDHVILWCSFPPKTGVRDVPNLIASIRFPMERYSGSAEELAQHIATIVANWTSSTQPAQP